MTNRVQNIILGMTLLPFAACWTWLVVETIPPGFGDGEIGARAFPMAFGIILIVLATMLLLLVVLQPAEAGEKAGLAVLDSESSKLAWAPAFLVLSEICLYGFLLEKIGFLLATPLVILIAMIVSLRVRSVIKLLSMSLGLTLGCWVIFEKLLGIYLANGTWINVG